MRTTRKDWWRTVAEEHDWLNLSLSYADAPFAVRVAALKDEERRFLREARTPAERLQLKRLIAKDVLTEAFSDGRSWSDFGPHLRRARSLGFADLWSRVHVACIYVRSLPSFPVRARDAFTMLKDAERRVLRRPKGMSSRQQMLERIENARKEAAKFGISG